MSKRKNVLTFWIVLISIVLIFYVLHIGDFVAIPFVIALFLSFSILTLKSFFQNFKIPKVIAFILAVVVHIFILFLITKIITTNIESLRTQIPFYQQRYYQLITSTAENLNLDPKYLELEIVNSIKFNDFLKYLLVLWTTIVRYAWTILFLTIFILIETRFFLPKIQKITWNNQIFILLAHIKKDIKSYFIIKTWISFATSFVVFIILLILKIDFALFWAFLVFILNYIPTIWSIIAVILPVVFSLLQFWDFGLTFSLLVVLTLVQMYFWNYLEPRLQWMKLNLSPLIIIFSLLIWWKVWGIVWMLLCVPIMVVINIILSYFPQTQWIAILFSERWDIRNLSENYILETNFLAILKRKIIDFKNFILNKKL